MKELREDYVVATILLLLRRYPGISFWGIKRVLAKMGITLDKGVLLKRLKYGEGVYM